MKLQPFITKCKVLPFLLSGMEIIYKFWPSIDLVWAQKHRVPFLASCCTKFHKNRTNRFKVIDKHCFADVPTDRQSVIYVLGQCFTLSIIKFDFIRQEKIHPSAVYEPTFVAHTLAIVLMWHILIEKSNKRHLLTEQTEMQDVQRGHTHIYASTQLTDRQSLLTQKHKV